jgi:hypothetical protein
MGRLFKAAIRRPRSCAFLLVALHPPRGNLQQPPDLTRRSQCAFKWKDYRSEQRERQKIMTLAVDEFIRRFLTHVLPKGLHRIRHYGLFAKRSCADNIARARELLAVAKPEADPTSAAVDPGKPTCPCCGGRMIILEVFERGATPRHRPTAPTSVIRIDTS